MGRISENAFEQSSSPIPTAVEPQIQTVLHTGVPMLFAGVNRKVNIGNFENIDVYCALSVPIMLVPGGDEETFRRAVVEAAELAFALASKETAARYSKIKDMQGGGRQKT